MADQARADWLEEAMMRYEAELLRMCFAYLGDLALAEDAVQETFVKAYKGYDRFRAAAEEKTWLIRIAINTCKDLRRSAWLRHVDRTVSLDTLPEAAAPFSPADDTLTRAVMSLKPKLRSVVLLHDYQGLSGLETAGVLGIPRTTVYNRLNKAHSILKKELEAWYHEGE